jgi:hypothetical protein
VKLPAGPMHRNVEKAASGLIFVALTILFGLFGVWMAFALCVAVIVATSIGWASVHREQRRNVVG